MRTDKPGLVTLFLMTGLLLCGCMTIEVASNVSPTEDSTNGYEIVHGSIYGYRWRDYHVQKCDESALATVELNFNWIELLVSSVSLGLYVPQTVEWWCEDSSTNDDEEELGLDQADEFRN